MGKIIKSILRHFKQFHPCFGIRGLNRVKSLKGSKENNKNDMFFRNGSGGLLMREKSN
jgi:hypothetical protein